MVCRCRPTASCPTTWFMVQLLVFITVLILIDLPGDFADAFHGRDRIEMQAGHSGGHQLAALADGPFHTQAAHLVVGLAPGRFARQLVGQVAVERLGDGRKLRQLGQRLYARNDGDGDALLAGHLDKLEIFAVVVEQLRHGITGAHLGFAAQDFEIGLQIGRFLVFFGIAGHTERKRFARLGNRSAVVEKTRVEAVDLTDQVERVGMTSRSGAEGMVLAGLVAPEHKQVGNAEELQVEQHILDVLAGESAAECVGHHVEPEFLPDGGRHGDRPRAAAQAFAAGCAVAQIFVDIFAAVGGDVDIKGVELAQGRDGGKELPRARTLQGGQHFERKRRAARSMAGYEVYDIHLVFILGK